MIDRWIADIFFKPESEREIQVRGAFWKHFYTLDRLNQSRLLTEIAKPRPFWRREVRICDEVDPYVNSLSRNEVNLLVKKIVDEIL